jgi:3-phenylpropionate/trans-cinnamate dioxygenase ferredoxin reductase subunit
VTARPVHLVVGGGLAGATAAVGLREAGFDGRIVLVGEEPGEPYERPPLSKEYLRGERDGDAVLVHPPAAYADAGVELLAGTRVVAVDPAAGVAVLDGGERLRWDRLLLATGSSARRLPVPGADLDGVHHLRTLADADALAAGLRGAGRVVVVGAGWIGTEVAASARALGRDVVVVAPDDVPLQRVLGVELGAVFRDLHAEHGVDLRLGTGVDAVVGTGSVEGVRLGDGTVVEADLVVAGVGAVPRTELAEAAGLAVDRGGVVVDAHLRASAPGVFAAGDIASAWHAHYRRHVRLEHWANARHQGAAAARSMLGAGEPYDRLPYFFTDQYDLGMELSGDPTGAARVVVRGDVAERRFVAFWLDGEDRVLAAMNVNVWDVVDGLQALIRSGRPATTADLDAALTAGGRPVG